MMYKIIHFLELHVEYLIHFFYRITVYSLKRDIQEPEFKVILTANMLTTQPL